MTRARIGIDARALGNINRNRGIGRYTARVVENLVGSPDGLEFVLFGFGDGPAPGTLDRSVLSGVEWIEIPKRGKPTEFPSPREYLPFARAVGQARLSLFHGIDHNMTPFLVCPSIVTVHDLILLVLRGPYLGPSSMVWMKAHRVASRKARFVVAVSECTGKDVHRIWGIPEGRIVVVPEGVEPVYSPQGEGAVAEALARYGVERPYMLYLGGFDPRKNIVNMLLAFKRYRLAVGGPVRLVLCGDPSGFEGDLLGLIEELGLGDAVKLAGFIADGDLPALYSGAECLVFVSVYEGFGLPLLEAMACGTPVLASDVSSIPEVVGDAGILVDPLEPDEIADGMARLTGDRELHDRLSVRGLERASGFTWDRTTERIREIYDRVLEGGGVDQRD